MKTSVGTQNVARKTIGRSKAIRFATVMFVGALVCCAGLALVTRARNAEMPGIKAPVVVAAELATQAGESKRGPIQVVRFALYDVGIYPSEAYAEKGLVGISFEDLSGGASEVVITRETGAAPAAVGRVQRVDNNSRGRSDLKLEPGRYEIYAADRPENRATLIVE